jgi:hypothetical protein
MLSISDRWRMVMREVGVKGCLLKYIGGSPAERVLNAPTAGARLLAAAGR